MPAAAQGFPTADTLSSDHGTNLSVRECSLCGLVQLEDDPVPYYKEVIRAAAYSAEMREFRLTQFRDWVKRHELLGQDVLEVGCGKGEYLSLLAESGAKAAGLEYSQHSVSVARDMGLEVYQGFLQAGDDSALESRVYQGFVCLNFLEHWPDPNGSLKILNHHLKDGAIGLVEVPNFDMILKQGLYSEFISDHLLYFTTETLRFLLQKNGFEVLDINSVWHDYSLSAVIKKRAKLDLHFFNAYRESISRELNAFIDGFAPGQVAVWGAGHQALAVLALADLGTKIRYVVDSAPFKQGRFTPATHLPIVSPDHFERNAVSAVIVMAASYSDEVARNLRARPGNAATIAVLRDHGLEILG